MSYGNGRQLSINYDNKLRMTRWMWPECWALIMSIAGRILLDRPSRTAVPMRRWTAGTTMTTWDGCTLHAAGRKRALPMVKLSTANMTGLTRWVCIRRVGNITSKDGWGGENPAYTATYTNNRRDGFGYDFAGNLTNDGLQSFTYDATGQQTYASGTGLSQIMTAMV